MIFTALLLVPLVSPQAERAEATQAEKHTPPPVAAVANPIPAVSQQELREFAARVLSATTKHLNQLITPEGKVVELVGNSADGMTASALYTLYEVTGNQVYRAAAVELADRILRHMKATKFGVLYIKEKETGDGTSLPGGGPPALGSYASAVAYILHKEGGRADDVRYVATVIDNFPWTDEGWWANTIDITTGRPKRSLDDPGAVNKNAGMALAAGLVADCVRDADPVLSARLKSKVDKCVYRQIVPAQEPDGFWHYGLRGNDPNNKDILGYFMLTAAELIRLRQSVPAYREPVLGAAIEKACGFALKEIAPMTDPNQGPSSRRTTRSTPTHYPLAKGAKHLKRGFSVGTLLIAGKHYREGMKIVDHWMPIFPTGDRSADGAHAVDSYAQILSLLFQEIGRP